MTAPPQAQPQSAAPRIDWLGMALRGIDDVLRQSMGIEEFCPDTACIIRIALRKADRDLRLADGTAIRQADDIGELHLWNEHLPRLAESNSALAWAIEIRRRFVLSFARLAHHIESDPRFHAVAAFRGGITFAHGINRAAKIERLMQWYEIEVISREPKFFPALCDFGNALFTLCLIRAFHPGGSFGTASLRRRHCELWLSRRVLLERYGPIGSALAGDAKAPPARRHGAA